MVFCPNYVIIFYKRVVFQIFSFSYSFILYDSLAWQFFKKPILIVFILQKKCLRIITFSFYKDHSNLLFKGLKLLKRHDVLESEIIKFFCRFSRNEMSKLLCSQFNLVHEVHTCNTRNNFSIYMLRMSTSRYGNCSFLSRPWFDFIP